MKTVDMTETPMFVIYQQCAPLFQAACSRTSQQHFLLVKSLWGDLLMGPALRETHENFNFLDFPGNYLAKKCVQIWVGKFQKKLIIFNLGPLLSHPYPKPCIQRQNEVKVSISCLPN